MSLTSFQAHTTEEGPGGHLSHYLLHVNPGTTPRLQPKSYSFQHGSRSPAIILSFASFHGLRGSQLPLKQFQLGEWWVIFRSTFPVNRLHGKLYTIRRAHSARHSTFNRKKLVSILQLNSQVKSRVSLRRLREKWARQAWMGWANQRQNHNSKVHNNRPLSLIFKTMI